jgi:predicted amidophosphoribosyltransferase
MEAIADPPAYNRARAAVRDDETARTMVQAFKYSDRLDLAPAMGRWMAQAGQELLAEANALIPVPLHWRRLWSRRFNQAATLARTVSPVSGVPVACHALRRARATRQQVGLTQPNAPSTCRVHFVSGPTGAMRSTASGWCLSMTS